MANRDIVLSALRNNNGCHCDDCISRASGVHPRQQVNQICRELERQGIIARVPGHCDQSNRQKLKNNLRVRR